MEDYSEVKMRISYTLSLPEIDELERIARSPHFVRGERLWAFWKRIAHEHKMRPDSIMGEGHSITGLPLSSSLHWCYPMPLKCEQRPKVYNERSET